MVGVVPEVLLWFDVFIALPVVVVVVIYTLHPAPCTLPLQMV